MTDIVSISGSYLPPSIMSAQGAEGAQRLRDAARKQREASAAAASEAGRAEDGVEVSAHAYFTAKVRNLPVRQDLVDRVKREIASGRYDTAEKIDAALDEMISDFR